MSEMTKSQIEKDGPIAVDCPSCNVAAGTRCSGKRGWLKSFHKERTAAHKALVAKAPKATYLDKRDSFYQVQVSKADTEDAERYLRNLTYGIQDDTLVPADIIRELLKSIDDVVTQRTESIDDELSETQAEVTRLEKDLELARKEAARNLEGRDNWKRLYDQAVADAIAAKDRALEFERKLTCATHPTGSTCFDCEAA